MRLLVTGGSGFVGSAVTDRLLAHGHEVYVVDDLSTGKLANLGEARREGNLKFHRFDICSDGITELFLQARPEVVLHLAAQGSVPVSVGRPAHDANINIIGLLRVLEACVTAETRKVVFAQSGGAMYGPQTDLPVKETTRGEPSSPYGITKHTAEHYLRFFFHHHGLDFMSLALANVYGPRQDPFGEAGVVAIFASKLLAGEAPTINGTGEDTRDYVFVGDVADAFVRAVDRGSAETVNIATGLETSVQMLYERMASAAGFTGQPVHGPPRPGDVPRSCLDPSKAAEVLGWRPWTTLQEGVEQTLAWFRKEGK